MKFLNLMKKIYLIKQFFINFGKDFIEGNYSLLINKNNIEING